MEQVTYRSLRKEDYSRVKELINKAFGFYEFIKDEKFLDVVLNVYLQDCILASTYSKVAVKDGKVIGIILGSADKDKKISTMGNYISVWRAMGKIVLTNKANKVALNEFKKIQKVYDEIIEGKREKFQGAIQLFIVSEECQGLGVGKALVREVSNYMKEMGVKALYLYTDTRCNYGFYDSQNFNRLKEKQLKFQVVPASLTVYLYSYEF